MRRFILFVMVLFLAGTLAFAQMSPQMGTDWRFGGFLYTTLGFDPENLYWAGTDVIIDGMPSTLMYYLRLNGSWTRSNYGFNFIANAIEGFDVSESARSTQMPGVSLHSAWGHALFFEEKLLVQFGKVFDTQYNSQGRLSLDGGEGTGIYFHLRPINNLSVAVGAFAPEGGGPLEAGQLTFGLLYEIPRTFRFSIGSSVRDEALYRFTNGISYNPTPNLRFHNEVSLLRASTGTGDFQYYGMVDQSVSYRMNNLSIGMFAYQFINNGNRYGQKSRDTQGGFGTVPVPDGRVARLGLSFDPWISYRINNITPRLTFSGESYGFKDYTVMGLEREKERFSFSIKPSVALQLGMSGQLELSYTYRLNRDTTTIAGNADDPVLMQTHMFSLTSVLMF